MLKSRDKKAAPVRLDGFRPEFLDFGRGVRVGHLEPHERITQVLKLSLEQKYDQPFVCDRYGRGVYWQWICFVPKANRQAKPLSSHVNFGCAKLFIMVDTSDRRFKAGLQIERGFLRSSPYPDCVLARDWDWHRLLASIQPRSVFMREVRRLLQEEDFEMTAGSFQPTSLFTGKNPPSPTELRESLHAVADDSWAGFQLYYPMTEQEVKASTGHDLVEAMLAIFDEVVPAMNSCMQVPVTRRDTHAGREA